MHLTVHTLLVSCFAFAIGVSAQAPPNPPVDCAPHHVLIKFRDSVRDSLAPGSDEQVLGNLLKRLNLPDGCKLEESNLRKLLKQRAPGKVAGPDFKRFLYLKLPHDLAPGECIKQLKDHPLLDYVEPDGVGTGGLSPNDPNFFQQWHHNNSLRPTVDISTPETWDITTGSTNVILAILDTGLNTTLPEFTGRLVPGYDFANNDNDPTDDQGHGTAVTGTAAATGNNSNRVAGVDWNCRIMPVKVLDSGNSGFYSWWADGIDFAVANGAKVINLSAGGSTASASLTTAIDNAIAAGVLFVTITHNDGANNIRFPGELPQAITIGATRNTDVRWSSSNWGPQIDLVAPGVGIYTFSDTGSVGPWSGTSFAAPLVSGVCALLASIKPDITQAEAAAILTSSAEDQVGDSDDLPGWDEHYGWGRLNAFAAVMMVNTNAIPLVIEELLATGSDWKYLDDGSDQGTAWRSPAFNDSTWQQGPAQLGYGDGDESTVVSFGPSSSSKYITTYFRRELVISNIANIESLSFQLLRDDGAVLYLNGTEALRSNLDPGTVTSTTLAGTTVDGGSEDVFYPINANPSLLVEGTNVVAVEIHQISGTSSDISFDLRLTAGRRIIPDADADGMPDSYEVAQGFDPEDPSDATADADGDHFTNLEEYISGTDPHDVMSFLRIERITRVGSLLGIEFLARSNKTYSIQLRNNAVSGPWATTVNIPAQPTNRTEVVNLPVPPISLYFRLVTP